MKHQLMYFSGERIDISKKKYDFLLANYQKIISALLFEESIDNILSNYIDYETYIYKCNLFRSLIARTNYSKIRIELNRLYSNILSIIYNYSEYGNIRIKLIADCNIFKETKKKIKDPIFLFMEELRNYTQHYGSPINLITFHANDSDIFEPTKKYYGITPYIDILALKNNKDFMNSPKADIKKRQSAIDKMINSHDIKISSTDLIKKYIDCISNLHKTIRIFIKDSIDIAMNEICNAVGDDPIGVTLIKDDGTKESETDISKTLLDDYQYLLSKYNFDKLDNILLSNLVIDK